MIVKHSTQLKQSTVRLAQHLQLNDLMLRVHVKDSS